MWRPLALGGLVVLPVLVLTQTCLGPRQGPCFRNVQELKTWAEERGLYCQSDRRDGKVAAKLALSTRPLTWQQVGGLLKQPGAHWDGVIWAINRTTGTDAAPVPPWNGECRVWGGILVTGDRHLLDRIEDDES
jgi:hypothetical protein